MTKTKAKTYELDRIKKTKPKTKTNRLGVRLLVLAVCGYLIGTGETQQTRCKHDVH